MDHAAFREAPKRGDNKKKSGAGHSVPDESKSYSEYPQQTGPEFAMKNRLMTIVMAVLIDLMPCAGPILSAMPAASLAF